MRAKFRIHLHTLVINNTFFFYNQAIAAGKFDGRPNQKCVYTTSTYIICVYKNITIIIERSNENNLNIEKNSKKKKKNNDEENSIFYQKL